MNELSKNAISSDLVSEREIPKYFSLLAATGFIFALLPIWPLILAPVPISLLGVILCGAALIRIKTSKNILGKKIALSGIVLGIINFFIFPFLLQATQGIGFRSLEKEFEQQDRILYPNAEQITACDPSQNFHYDSLAIAATQPQNVCSFTMQGEGLNRVPEEVRQFKNMRILNLRDNRLSTLPPWLVELSRIEKLDLADNYFFQLPAEVYGLPQLKVIDMSGNPLPQPVLDDAKAKVESTAIWYNWHPKEPKLQELLSQSGIGIKKYDSLEAALAEPENVQHLKLIRQCLTDIPSQIVQLKNLRILEISENNIKTVPSFITQLTNLEQLYLDQNEISQLNPDIFSQLRQLKKLSLSNNEIPEETLNRLRQLLPGTEIEFNTGAKLTKNCPS